MPIPGTEGGRTPFFSPDGSAIGYVSGNSIMRLSIDQSGFGVPVAVTATEGQSTGVSWGEDGMIYFTAISRLAPLRVPASGGTIEEITVADTHRAAGRYAAPQLLPGGQALLVTVRETEGTAVRSSVAVLSFASGRERILTTGTGALYLASGHLLWSVPVAPNAPDAPLLAAPFDLQSLELTGAVRPLPFRVGASPVDGRPHLAASRTGLVVYAPDFLAARDSLVWVERDGTTSAVTAAPEQVWNPRLSPDGRRVAYAEANLTSVRILDLERMAISTLAIGGNINAFPMWMPDSDRLLVMASPDGPLDIISAAADSSGAWETVFHSDNTVVALSVSPDGTLLYYEVSTQGVRNIWALPPSGVPRPLVVTEASERAPMMSPDGRYFAYVSDEEGSTEVYVRPYPDAGSRVRISTDGGTEPVWRRDGRELFYRSHDRMMSVSIQTEPSFRAGEPETLFEQPFQLDQWGNANYDVSLDGDRLLMVRTTPSTTTRLPVIINWFDELKRLVPTDP